MKKSSNRTGRVLSWLIFIGLAGVIFFLSVQNGDTSKAIGDKIVGKILHEADAGENNSSGILKSLSAIIPGDAFGDEMLEVTYLLRQMGRVILFFCLGVISTAAMNLTFIRMSRGSRFMLITAFLGAFAYLTEKLKIYISDRHYSPEEMLVSFLAGMTGFLLTALIIAVFRLLFQKASESKKYKKYGIT